ncbi:MAG: TorF family putative porin [Paraperlucidibaca sp.]
MKLSKLSHAVIAASLMTAGAMAHAEITTSGSVALTSDYLFRGISQSAENMAVQGSFTVSHDSGMYFTAWGSSISKEATGVDSSSGLELDTLLGYAGETAGGVGYDVGVMRYNYPGADDGAVTTSYNEVYGSVSYAGAKVGVAYSNDYFAETGKYLYVYTGYSTELMENLSGSVSVGWNKFDDAGGFLVGGNSDAYFDYKVGLSTELKGIGLEAAYIGSDSIAEAAYGEGAQGRMVFTASKSF